MKSLTWTVCRCLNPKGEKINSSVLHVCSKCTFGLRAAGYTQILARYSWNKHLKELAPSWAYYCKHHLSILENLHPSQTPFSPSADGWKSVSSHPTRIGHCDSHKLQTQWLQLTPRTKATWPKNAPTSTTSVSQPPTSKWVMDVFTTCCRSLDSSHSLEVLLDNVTHCSNKWNQGTPAFQSQWILPLFIHRDMNR